MGATNGTAPGPGGRDVETLIEDIVSGDISMWELFLGSYIESMGVTAFVLIVGGVTTLALLSWTRNFTITATWLLLLGGFFVILLPPAAATTAALLVTALLAVAFYSTIWRNIGA
jgi:hypothetical protein